MGVAMADYNSPVHRQTRAAWSRVVKAGDAWCAEVVCLMESRWIPPDSRWHLAHDHSDPTGQRYLGPAHERCNTSEGATRGNIARGRPARRWVL